MRVQLEPRWVKRLSRLPESGMGYHRVDVLTADGRTLRDLVVLNAEVINLPDDIGKVTISDLQPHTEG